MKTFALTIISFDYLPSADVTELSQFIDIFEKNYSMKHVPREIIYIEEKDQDLFYSSGYYKEKNVMKKLLTKTLKI